MTTFPVPTPVRSRAPQRGGSRRVRRRAPWRLLTALAALAVLSTGCAGPGVDPVPLPSFEQPTTAPVEPAQWRAHGPLPDDCAVLMSTDELTALLGRPLGSVALRTVRGVPEPSVGRIARLGCRYSASDRSDSPLLTLNIGRYTSEDAAAKQWKLNSDAERAGSPSSDLRIGAAPAVRVERARETILIVAYSDCTITLVLPSAADQGTKETLVDLALRVIPRLVPPPAPTSANDPQPGDPAGADPGTRIRAAEDASES